METYSALRTFADSWALLFLFLFFIGVIVWVFRPGSRSIYRDAANMIFRNEDRPKDEGSQDGAPRNDKHKDDRNGH